MKDYKGHVSSSAIVDDWLFTHISGNLCKIFITTPWTLTPNTIDDRKVQIPFAIRLNKVMLYFQYKLPHSVDFTYINDVNTFMTLAEFKENCQQQNSFYFGDTLEFPLGTRFNVGFEVRFAETVYPELFFQVLEQ